MADRKFTRKERLSSRKDIDRVFRDGLRVSRGVVAITVTRNDLDYSRLGVGASSRSFNAVKRNRLKRLAREAFRLNKEKIPVGLDIFAVVNNADATLSQVEKALVDASNAAQKKLSR